MIVQATILTLVIWCGSVASDQKNEKRDEDQPTRRMSYGFLGGASPSSWVSYGRPSQGASLSYGGTPSLGTAQSYGVGPSLGSFLSFSAGNASPGVRGPAVGNTGLGTSPVVTNQQAGPHPGAGTSSFSASLSIGGPGSGIRIATSPSNGISVGFNPDNGISPAYITNGINGPPQGHGVNPGQLDLSNFYAPYSYSGDSSSIKSNFPYSYYNRYKYEGPSRPYPVYIPKPYPVYFEKKVPVEVKVPVPQPFEVEKPIHVPLPIQVEKPYPVVVEKRVPVPVEKIVPLTLKEYVTRPYPFPVPVDKYVPVPYDKHVAYPHKHLPVPVERPYQSFTGAGNFYPGVQVDPGYYYPYHSQQPLQQEQVSYSPFREAYDVPQDYLRMGEQRNYQEDDSESRDEDHSMKKSEESDDDEEAEDDEQEVEHKSAAEMEEGDDQDRNDVKRQAADVDENTMGLESQEESSEDVHPLRVNLLNDNSEQMAEPQNNETQTTTLPDLGETSSSSEEAVVPMTTTENPMSTSKSYGDRIMRITTHHPTMPTPTPTTETKL